MGMYLVWLPLVSWLLYRTNRHVLFISFLRCKVKDETLRDEPPLIQVLTRLLTSVKAGIYLMILAGKYHTCTSFFFNPCEILYIQNISKKSSFSEPKNLTSPQLYLFYYTLNVNITCLLMFNNTYLERLLLVQCLTSLRLTYKMAFMFNVR